MRDWSVAALLVLATACASGAGTGPATTPGSQVGSPTPSSPGSPAVPDRLTITATDNGETFTVSKHTRAQLNLGGPGEAWTAEVDGTAIMLVELHGFADPGHQAWEIQILEPGEAQITASSEDQSFTARIVVVE